MRARLRRPSHRPRAVSLVELLTALLVISLLGAAVVAAYLALQADAEQQALEATARSVGREIAAQAALHPDRSVEELAADATDGLDVAASVEEDTVTFADGATSVTVVFGRDGVVAIADAGYPLEPVGDGLVLHVDASDVGGASDGEPVDPWPDQPGRGNHLTGGAGTLRDDGHPLPYLELSGGSYTLDPADDVTGVAEITWVFVHAVDDPAAESAFGFSWQNYSYAQLQDDANARFFVAGGGSQSRLTASPHTYEAATPHVTTLSYAEGPDRHFVRIDGSTIGAMDGQVTQTGAASSLDVFNVNWSQPYGGRVWAVLAYDRQLSDAELADVEAWAQRLFTSDLD